MTCGTLLAWLAQPSQEQLKERKEKKLQAAFLTRAPWLTDYDRAREESKKTGKPIFAYFTRSYSP